MRFALYALVSAAQVQATALGGDCTSVACATTGQECDSTDSLCKWSAVQADGVDCVVKYHASDCSSGYCKPTTGTTSGDGVCTAKLLLGGTCAVQATAATDGYTEGSTGMGNCAALNGDECNSTSLVCKWTSAQANGAVCNTATAGTDCTSAECSVEVTTVTTGICKSKLWATCTLSTTTTTNDTHDCAALNGDKCAVDAGSTTDTATYCQWTAAAAVGGICKPDATATHPSSSADCASAYCVLAATTDTLGLCTAKPTLGETCTMLTTVTPNTNNCGTGEGDQCSAVGTATATTCNWSAAQAAGATCLTSTEKTNDMCTDGWCDPATMMCAKKPGVYETTNDDGKMYYEVKTIWHLGSAIMKCALKFKIGCAMNTLFKNIGALFKFF